MTGRGVAPWLLWIACCALYFVLARQFLVGPPRDLLQLGHLCLLAAYIGFCWSAALGVTARLLVPRRPVVEPGEWLLLSLGFILAVDVAVTLLPASIAIRKPSLSRLAPVWVCWSRPSVAGWTRVGASCSDRSH